MLLQELLLKSNSRVQQYNRKAEALLTHSSSRFPSVSAAASSFRLAGILRETGGETIDISGYETRRHLFCCKKRFQGHFSILVHPTGSAKLEHYCGFFMDR